ncbi:uncharacterized protein LOC135137620 [Zophobas morio]|uniref:uncharacterized protein LOC135137620 n=1 Tax=Zophobas morio TaxID=2755281 RepID=UPI0030839D20
MANLEGIEYNTKELITIFNTNQEKMSYFLKNHLEQLLTDYLYFVKQHEDKSTVEIEKLINTAKTKLQELPTYEVIINENLKDEDLIEMKDFFLDIHIKLTNNKVLDYRSIFNTAVYYGSCIEKSSYSFDSKEQYDLPKLLKFLYLSAGPQKATNILYENKCHLNKVSENISTLNMQNVDLANVERIQQQLEEVLAKLTTIDKLSTHTSDKLDQNETTVDS